MVPNINNRDMGNKPFQRCGLLKNQRKLEYICYYRSMLTGKKEREKIYFNNFLLFRGPKIQTIGSGVNAPNWLLRGLILGSLTGKLHLKKPKYWRNGKYHIFLTTKQN
jgi:hypothetical protein